MINYKKYLYLVFLFFSSLSWGQTGINTRTPNASAALDVTATDRGVLLPQYTLGILTDAVNPIIAPLEGSLIYNIGGVNPKGYYYWTGQRWERLIVNGETDQILNIRLAGFTPTGNAVTLIPGGVTTANIVGFPAAYTTVVNTIVGVNYSNGASINLPIGTYRVDITFDCMSPAGTNNTNFESAGDNQLFVVNAGIVNSANTLISDLKVSSTISQYGGVKSVQGYKFSYIIKLGTAQDVKVMLNHNNGASDSSLTRDNQAGLIVTFYKFFE
ncbi:hypothetical protein OQX61_22360 [Pedobacter sp. PLR]|uniref:hypothetical protein n=1 Tax=Pedobacter sp. PLR TaxID=2994465 RepID=UPI002246BD03|nr:hypothetical protein [Pedobacter sp. PLR]MCX2454029.1 hypothetical protein [Pedobacter sp. PLR]